MFLSSSGFYIEILAKYIQGNPINVPMPHLLTERANEQKKKELARRWRNKLVAHYYEKPLGYDYDYEANKQGKEGEGNSTNEEYYEFGGAYHSGDFLVKQSDAFSVFWHHFWLETCQITLIKNK